MHVRYTHLRTRPKELEPASFFGSRLRRRPRLPLLLRRRLLKRRRRLKRLWLRLGLRLWLRLRLRPLRVRDCWNKHQQPEGEDSHALHHIIGG
jgi:hypothetical protein